MFKNVCSKVEHKCKFVIQSKSMCVSTQYTNNNTLSEMNSNKIKLQRNVFH